MHGGALTATMIRADVMSVMSRTQIERRGRWRSFRRSLSTVLGLYVVLAPLYLVCWGWLPSVGPLSSSIPARLALLVEVVLIRCYIQFAWRCLELVRSSRAVPVLQNLATVLMWSVGLSGFLDLVENVGIWLRLEGVTSYPVSLVLVDWLLWSHLITAAVGLIGLGLLAFVSSAGFWWHLVDGRLVRRRSFNRVPSGWAIWARKRSEPARIAWWKATLNGPAAPPAAVDIGGTMICCSGGGIRSAAFCLGGLQELDRDQVYRSARAVIGVSGGGYIAAALHVLRWRSHQGDDQAWAPLDPGPFASDSEESRWLRRHTRYLFNSARLATLAGLSVIFGMSVNLFWCVVALGTWAWLSGWLVNATGALVGWSTLTATGGDYQGRWAWLGAFWVFPLVGVALFVLERFVTRLVTLPVKLRETLRTLGVGMLWVGLMLVAMVAVLPRLMAGMHNYAARSDSIWAGLIYAVGLVPDSVCQLGEVACGARSGNLSVPETTGASLAAVAAAVLAVVRLGVAKMPGQATSAGSSLSAVSALFRRVFAALKHVVIPWAALSVIIIAGLAVVMRWVAAFVTRPETLGNWPVIYGFGLTLIILTLFTDANWTSLHHFYRERISYAFLQERIGGTARPLSFRDKLRFSESAPPPGGGPELVACAVANVSDVEYVPADRRATPFVFDAHLIGLTDRTLARQVPSSTYEYAADFRMRDATIPAAMAMSGAAFSPLVGREQRRVAPYRLIMALANARLGVWLPNPMWTEDVTQVRRMIKTRQNDAPGAWLELAEADREFVRASMISERDERWLTARLTRAEVPVDTRRVQWRSWVGEVVRSVLNQPGAYRLFKEGVGGTSLTERRLYITDGGHYDNLGLVEALRRQASVIYVLDASNDEANTFRALGEAMATARIDLDCELELDPEPMRTDADGVAEVAWQSGSARYADGSTAVVHFIKAIRRRSMSLDIQVYAGRHPDFPRTSTGNQFYGEFDFEAYRQLGAEATRGLLDSLPPPDVQDNGTRPRVSEVLTPARR